MHPKHILCLKERKRKKLTKVTIFESCVLMGIFSLCVSREGSDS